MRLSMQISHMRMYMRAGICVDMLAGVRMGCGGVVLRWLVAVGCALGLMWLAYAWTRRQDCLCVDKAGR